MSKKISLQLMLIMICVMSDLSQAQVKPKDSTSTSPVAADNELVLIEQKPPVRCLPGVADFSARLRTPAEPNIPDPIISTSAGDTYGQGKNCFSGYYEVEATNTTGLDIRVGVIWGDSEGNPRPNSRSACMDLNTELQVWGFDGSWKYIVTGIGEGWSWTRLASGTYQCVLRTHGWTLKNHSYSKIRIMVKASQGSSSMKVTGYIRRYIVVN